MIFHTKYTKWRQNDLNAGLPTSRPSLKRATWVCGTPRALRPWAAVSASAREGVAAVEEIAARPGHNGGLHSTRSTPEAKGRGQDSRVICTDLEYHVPVASAWSRGDAAEGRGSTCCIGLYGRTLEGCMGLYGSETFHRVVRGRYIGIPYGSY